MSSYLEVGKDLKYHLPKRLTPAQHQQAIYVLGKSGTGKSTLLGNLAVQFHAMGEGVLVIDIKDSKLTADIAARTPRPEDTIYVAPGLCHWDGEKHFWSFNALDYAAVGYLPNDEAAEEIVGGTFGMFERMARANSEFMTRVARYLPLAVRVAIARPDATLLDVEAILSDREERTSRLKPPVTPQTIKAWRKFERDNKTDKDQAAKLESTINRVAEFTDPPFLNFMVSQPRTTLKLEEWLDQGKLVLCNLAEGVHEHLREPLGNLVMAQAVNAAFRRQNAEVEGRRVWRYIVDEFDVLAPEQFSDLIDKARSFRVFPVMSHQHKGQLTKGRAKDSRIFEAASGAPVTLRFSIGEEDRRQLSFTRGQEEAERLSQQAKFTAELELDGPRDSSNPMALELPNWWAERDEDQLKELIDRQRPDTRPRSELARENRRRYYKPERLEASQGQTRNDTSRSNDRRNDRHNRQASKTQEHQTEPVSARPERPSETDRDDRAGSGDSHPPRPAPIRYRRSGPDDF
ncbi:MAG: hypothetical protein M3Q03_16540 [Chloroflexota bacterium]|nr:hypothetical protein [Chloroflexota bacterium]